MTYIELANRYWNYHRREALTTSATHLFFWLLDSFSEARDRTLKSSPLPGFIRRTDGAVAGGAGLSINAMKAARTHLTERGLLAVKLEGTGMKNGAVYQLTSSNFDEVVNEVNPSTSSNFDEVVDEVTGQPNQQPHQQPHQQPRQNLMRSIYSIPEPETEPDKNTHSQNARSGVPGGRISGETEILEIEIEDVFFEGKKIKPPHSAPPPGTPGRSAAAGPERRGGPSDCDEAELQTFTENLQTNRRLAMGLRRQFGLSGEVADDWIARYVLSQWTIGNLRHRLRIDLFSHCQSWIGRQLEIEHERQQRNQQRSGPHPNGGQHRNRANENRAETGSELDRLIAEQFGS